jgi:hypothetical protein
VPLTPACSSSDAQGGGGGETLTSGKGSDCAFDVANIQQEIFLGTCAEQNCHAAHSPAAALDLETANVAARLVGIPSSICDGKTRIVAGAPEESFLYEKITSYQPLCGSHMPVTGDLTVAERACVKQWIAGLPPVVGGGTGGDAGCESCGGSACVDLSTDPANCGGCRKACPAGAGCSGGACVCPSGTSECGGACVDPSSDPANCGGCGKPCGATEVCKLGVCSASCGTLTKCGASCVDTSSSEANCGGCGKACSMGQICSGGSCACGGGSVSFSAAVQPIFTASCAQGGCHGGAMPQQGLNLSAGKAHQALVNITASECKDGRQRVLPGQPQQSYLLDKVMGVDLCSGSKMPKLTMLPSGDIQTISNWICQGAPNN